jgi:hypothetical protein
LRSPWALVELVARHLLEVVGRAAIQPLLALQRQTVAVAGLMELLRHPEPAAQGAQEAHLTGERAPQALLVLPVVAVAAVQATVQTEMVLLEQLAA